jgi:hypothetical protein
MSNERTCPVCGAKPYPGDHECGVLYECGSGCYAGTSFDGLGCLREQIRDVTAERDAANEALQDTGLLLAQARKDCDALRRMLAAAEVAIFEEEGCPYMDQHGDAGDETCGYGERCEACRYAAVFALAEAVREDGDDE